MKKILLCLWDGLSDGVAGTALLRPLRLTYPGCRIDVWTKPSFAGLLEDQSLIDDLMVSEIPWEGASRRHPGWSDFLSALLAAKKARYDAALLMKGSASRSAVLSLAAPARVVRLSRTSGAWRRRRDFVREAGLDQYREAIERWAGSPPERRLWRPRIDVSRREAKWARDWREKRGWRGRPIVAVQPAAPHPGWDIARSFAAIRWVTASREEPRFVILSAPDHRAAIEREWAQLNRESCAVVGATALTLKAVLSTATVFFDAGSEWSSLGAALGVPTVAVAPPVVWQDTAAPFESISPLPVDPVRRAAERLMAHLDGHDAVAEPVSVTAS